MSQTPPIEYDLQPFKHLLPFKSSAFPNQFQIALNGLNLAILACQTQSYLVITDQWSCGSAYNEGHLQIVFDFESEFQRASCVLWLTPTIICVGFESGNVLGFDINSREKIFEYHGSKSSVQTLKSSTVSSINNTKLRIVPSLWILYETGLLVSIPTKQAIAGSIEDLFAFQFSNHSNLNDFVFLNQIQTTSIFDYDEDATHSVVVAGMNSALSIYNLGNRLHFQDFNKLAGYMKEKVGSIISKSIGSLFSVVSSLTSSSVDKDKDDITKTEEKTLLITSLVDFEDTKRRVIRLTIDDNSELIAAADSLGRVTLFDVQLNCVVRIWKGVRQAQMAWTHTDSIKYDSLSDETAETRVKLCLCIYAPLLGLVSIYAMRYGPCLRTIPVGLNCQLQTIRNDDETNPRRLKTILLRWMQQNFTLSSETAAEGDQETSSYIEMIELDPAEKSEMDLPTAPDPDDSSIVDDKDIDSPNTQDDEEFQHDFTDELSEAVTSSSVAAMAPTSDDLVHMERKLVNKIRLLCVELSSKHSSNLHTARSISTAPMQGRPNELNSSNVITRRTKSTNSDIQSSSSSNQLSLELNGAVVLNVAKVERLQNSFDMNEHNKVQMNQDFFLVYRNPATQSYPTSPWLYSIQNQSWWEMTTHEDFIAPFSRPMSCNQLTSTQRLEDQQLLYMTEQRILELLTTSMVDQTGPYQSGNLTRQKLLQFPTPKEYFSIRSWTKIMQFIESIELFGEVLAPISMNHEGNIRHEENLQDGNGTPSHLDARRGELWTIKFSVSFHRKLCKLVLDAIRAEESRNSKVQVTANLPESPFLHILMKEIELRSKLLTAYEELTELNENRHESIVHPTSRTVDILSDEVLKMSRQNDLRAETICWAIRLMKRNEKQSKVNQSKFEQYLSAKNANSGINLDKMSSINHPSTSSVLNEIHEKQKLLSPEDSVGSKLRSDSISSGTNSILSATRPAQSKQMKLLSPKIGFMSLSIIEQDSKSMDSPKKGMFTGPVRESSTSSSLDTLTPTASGGKNVNKTPENLRPSVESNISRASHVQVLKIHSKVKSSASAGTNNRLSNVHNNSPLLAKKSNKSIELIESSSSTSDSSPIDRQHKEGSISKNNLNFDEYVITNSTLGAKYAHDVHAMNFSIFRACHSIYYEEDEIQSPFDGKRGHHYIQQLQLQQPQQSSSAFLMQHKNDRKKVLTLPFDGYHDDSNHLQGIHPDVACSRMLEIIQWHDKSLMELFIRAENSINVQSRSLLKPTDAAIPVDSFLLIGNIQEGNESHGELMIPEHFNNIHKWEPSASILNTILSFFISPMIGDMFSMHAFVNVTRSIGLSGPRGIQKLMQLFVVYLSKQNIEVIINEILSKQMSTSLFQRWLRENLLTLQDVLSSCLPYLTQYRQKGLLAFKQDPEETEHNRSISCDLNDDPPDYERARTRTSSDIQPSLRNNRKELGSFSFSEDELLILFHISNEIEKDELPRHQEYNHKHDDRDSFDHVTTFQSNTSHIHPSFLAKPSPPDSIGMNSSNTSMFSESSITAKLLIGNHQSTPLETFSLRIPSYDEFIRYDPYLTLLCGGITIFWNDRQLLRPAWLLLRKSNQLEIAMTISSMVVETLHIVHEQVERRTYGASGLTLTKHSWENLIRQLRTLLLLTSRHLYRGMNLTIDKLSFNPQLNQKEVSIHKLLAMDTLCFALKSHQAMEHEQKCEDVYKSRMGQKSNVNDLHKKSEPILAWGHSADTRWREILSVANSEDSFEFERSVITRPINEDGTASHTKGPSPNPNTKNQEGLAKSINHTRKKKPLLLYFPNHFKPYALGAHRSILLIERWMNHPTTLRNMEYLSLAVDHTSFLSMEWRGVIASQLYLNHIVPLLEIFIELEDDPTKIAMELKDMASSLPTHHQAVSSLQITTCSKTKQQLTLQFMNEIVTDISFLQMFIKAAVDLLQFIRESVEEFLLLQSTQRESTGSRSSPSFGMIASGMIQIEDDEEDKDGRDAVNKHEKKVDVYSDETIGLGKSGDKADDKSIWPSVEDESLIKVYKMFYKNVLRKEKWCSSQSDENETSLRKGQNVSRDGPGKSFSSLHSVEGSNSPTGHTKNHQSSIWTDNPGWNIEIIDEHTAILLVLLLRFQCGLRGIKPSSIIQNLNQTSFLFESFKSDQVNLQKVPSSNGLNGGHVLINSLTIDPNTGTALPPELIARLTELEFIEQCLTRLIVHHGNDQRTENDSSSQHEDSGGNASGEKLDRDSFGLLATIENNLNGNQMEAIFSSSTSNALQKTALSLTYRLGEIWDVHTDMMLLIHMAALIERGDRDYEIEQMISQVSDENLLVDIICKALRRRIGNLIIQIESTGGTALNVLTSMDAEAVAWVKRAATNGRSLSTDVALQGGIVGNEINLATTRSLIMQLEGILFHVPQKDRFVKITGINTIYPDMIPIHSTIAVSILFSPSSSWLERKGRCDALLSLCNSLKDYRTKSPTRRKIK